MIYINSLVMGRGISKFIVFDYLYDRQQEEGTKKKKKISEKKKHKSIYLNSL